MKTPLLHQVENPRFQFYTAIAIALYIASLLAAQYHQTHFREPINQLTQPTAENIKLATNVEIGLFVNSFPDFSFRTQSFTMDAILWFRFDQGAESLATIKQFKIKNSIAMNNEHLTYTSKPNIKLIDDKVLIAYHIQSTFKTEVLFSKFPIAGHRLNFFIENKSATTNELLFSARPENFQIAKQFLVDTWKPIAIHTSAGIVSTELVSNIDGENEKAMEISYPSLAVSIDFDNIGARSLISLYFPLFVLFFIGLLSLCLGIFDGARLAVIASSFPTLVLFRLVIDSVSPDVGYATHIDYVYYVLVALSLFILIFQTYTTLMSAAAKESHDATRKAKIKRHLEILNVLLFYGLLLALVAIMTWDYFH